MAGAPRPITGRCLCGGVTFSADAEPVVQAVCHCTDCQRQTGNSFSVFVGVPRDVLHVEGDSLSSYTTIGEDTELPVERQFCSTCGSPVCSFAPAYGGLAFIKAGALDDASWLEPSMEVWTSSAQPWSPHFEHAARMERGPQ